jgi:hypothetical protein
LGDVGRQRKMAVVRGIYASMLRGSTAPGDNRQDGGGLKGGLGVVVQIEHEGRLRLAAKHLNYQALDDSHLGGQAASW